MRQAALEAALRDPPVRQAARDHGVEQRQPGGLPGGTQLAVETRATRRGRGIGERHPVMQPVIIGPRASRRKTGCRTAMGD
jgi:hypothetical protein